MTKSYIRLAAPVIALSLGLGLAGCARDGMENTSLYSVKQPVVERQNYTLDLATNANGLPVAEQKRLADWFKTLELGYGDRVAIDDAVDNAAVRENVAMIAGRHGLLLQDGVPVTEGFIDPGNVRIVITRSRAHVPGCPDWSDQFRTTLGNAQSDNFGCATNSNLAAMIADPEHLLEGAKGTGETVVMTSNRAIDSYRQQAPSGAEGLPAISSQGN